jgi:hypothetical protein
VRIVDSVPGKEIKERVCDRTFGCENREGLVAGRINRGSTRVLAMMNKIYSTAVYESSVESNSTSQKVARE